MNEAYQILKKGSFYEIYDIVACITTIMTTESLQHSIFYTSHDAFLEMFRCIEFMRQSLHKQSHSTSLMIIQSILSVFQCRMVSPCKSTRFINDGYSFVRRGGVIVNEFVEEMKKAKQTTAFFF